jgi:hypothetical protein
MLLSTLVHAIVFLPIRLLHNLLNVPVNTEYEKKEEFCHYPSVSALILNFLHTYSYILCRKLHNEELHDLYSLPSLIRLIKARRYRLLVGKSEGRRPIGRPRRRWVDNIRMDLVEVGWGDVDWIGLV